MKNREAQMLKDAIDMTLICLSHALEEPVDADTYIHIAMDYLDTVGRYVHTRQEGMFYTKEINDDEDELK